MKGFWIVVTKRPKVQGSEKLGVELSEVKWCEVKCSEVKWSEMIILCEMCILPLIYNYVAVRRFCTARCVIIICFCLLFWNYSTCVFNNIFIFSCFVFLFTILCILCFCIVLCIVSLFVYSCFIPIFAQVCWPLTPAGNPKVVNKYHIY